jgi:hypothetical protein
MNSLFQIDKKIPLPARGVNGKSKYPFLEMKVGDSVLFPDGEASRATIYAYCSRLKKDGMKFVTQVQKEPKGVRVWRTK